MQTDLIDARRTAAASPLRAHGVSAAAAQHMGAPIALTHTVCESVAVARTGGSEMR